MQQPVSFANWSLKKALHTQSDSLLKARIKILYLLLILSIAKSAIAVLIAGNHHQWFQVSRAAVIFVLYLVLLKLLLTKPDKVKFVAHTMIIAGTLLVWTNIAVYTHSVNLLIIQMILMMMLGSFYILGARFGFFYSAMNLVPAIAVLLAKGNLLFFHVQNLAAPAPQIIMVLNFITIILSHYFFYEAFISNLKEKETLNLQLQDAITKANKLAESKSNFLSTMSHELRTPLNSVIGISEILQDNNKDERQKENLQILSSASQDLLSLINNVLDFNKSEADKMILDAAPFNISRLVSDKCSGLLMKLKDKNIGFILDIDADLKQITVVSDPVRLSQVIYNLLSNAIKFTEQGNVTVRVETLDKTDKSVNVLFSITDTGIGIHPDKHESIFEMFTQAEVGITRTYGGTGLGLAIVKQILELFNSCIRLESSPGQGSTFSFVIAFDILEEVVKPEPSFTNNKQHLEHLRVLIAEDNEVNAVILYKQFEKLNIKAEIVGNGLQAYEQYQQGQFDIILLDLHMPVMDGFETVRKIRSMADPVKANVPVIAFTASAGDQDKILDAGFTDLLYKPANTAELYKKLQSVSYHLSL